MESKHYDIDVKRADVINFNQQPAKQRGVPACPIPNSPRIFGRTDLVNEMVGLLTAADGSAIYAVRGWPGVGKTAFTRAVGCDARIRQHFTGGVLYAELGQNASALAILQSWFTQFDQEPPKTADPAFAWQLGYHASNSRQLLTSY